MSFPHPIKDPPDRVKAFWRSPFGERLVRVLEPSKWWILIFIVGLVLVNVWTLTIYRQQTRDDARHVAEVSATAQTRYQGCLASIPVLIKINRFIRATGVVDRALVKNSRANLLTATPGTIAYSVKMANLARLINAEQAVHQVMFAVPTKRSCILLRTRLLNTK